MRKNVFNKLNKITLAILMGLMAFQISCSKDDDETLNGTVWKGTYEDYGEKIESTITFFKGNTFLMTEKIVGSSFSYSLEGTYGYSHPNITLYFELDGETGNVTGKVSGNKMTFPSEDSGDIVYTKQ